MLRRHFVRRAALLAAIPVATVALGAASGTALFGPPWISIEYPANPHDRTTRGAYLLVHAFHHSTPTGFPVTGTAEGLVDGKRRTVELRFENTSRAGVFSLRKQWPADGLWLLSITVHQDKFGATALVEIAPNGEVASVRVPTDARDGWQVPRQVTSRDREAALEAMATRQRGALARGTR